MSRCFHSALLTALLAAAMLVLMSCGSDDPASPDNPIQDDTTVTGVVVKGPVDGATVSIWTIGGDGGPADLVVDGVTTGADGAWSAVIPGAQSGDRFLVMAEGGTYEDEGTQAPVDVPAGADMIGLVDRARPSSVAVTPFTHMMWLQTREIVVGTGADLAWDRAIANASGDNSFGFDPTTTTPRWDIAATGAEKAYAALLGGLSGLPAWRAEYDVIMAANAFDRSIALAEDMMDGSLDGRAADGTVILVDVPALAQVALPAVSGTGVELISEAAAFYAEQTPELDGADLVEDMTVVMPDPGPDSIDCDHIEEAHAAARVSLANALFALLNGPDPQTPDDVDFTQTSLLYEAILQCDADDPDANLALAILDMTALAQDPDINDAFDEWDAYLDAMIPFETDSPGAGLTVPAGFATADGGMGLPMTAIRRSLVPFFNLKSVVAPPQIADVQDIFRNTVLPTVTQCIDHMDMVIADPSFTYDISPRMQGDLYEETREADYTDFMAIRAGMKALEAGLRIAISYRVNMPEYTGAELLLGLDQDDGYLATLQGDGAAQMAMVPGLLTGAADDLNAAIDALFAETDNQDDDLLKIGPADIDGAELLDFQADELARIRQSLDGPVTHTYDWDFDDWTDEQAMTVDFNAFFADAVADFKDLLPPYTVTLETVPYDIDWSWGDTQATITVDVPVAGNYSFGAYMSVWDFDDGWHDAWSMPSWAAAPVEAFLQEEMAAMAAAPDWAGDSSADVYFYGHLEAGVQVITLDYYWNTTTATAWVDVAHVTFAADSYAQWLSQFPDPTVNGLFPDLTSAAQLADAFGFEEYNWEKEFTIDWTGNW
jgi:hypothetical protein